MEHIDGLLPSMVSDKGGTNGYLIQAINVAGWLAKLD
jgi:hypothetical protein